MVVNATKIFTYRLHPLHLRLSSLSSSSSSSHSLSYPDVNFPFSLILSSPWLLPICCRKIFTGLDVQVKSTPSALTLNLKKSVSNCLIIILTLTSSMVPRNQYMGPLPQKEPAGMVKEEVPTVTETSSPAGSIPSLPSGTIASPFTLYLSLPGLCLNSISTICILISIG